jgi:integrase
MQRRVVEEANPLEHSEQLISGTLNFYADLAVSEKSRFGDSQWNWNDESNLRLKFNNPSKLLIDWAAITLESKSNTSPGRQLGHHQAFIPLLPKHLVEDLKRAFFIIAYHPLVRGIRSRRMKPVSIVRETRRAINFFSYIYSESLRNRPLSLIAKLSDIEIGDLRQGLETYPYERSRLRATLTWLASEGVQSNLKYGRLLWTSRDIRMMNWPIRKESGHIPTLPDRLFALLSNTSIDQILEFHHLMGNTTSEDMTDSAHRKLKQRDWPRFKEMFESYISRRELVRTKSGNWASNHTKRFSNRFGVMPGVVREFLYDVQTAAFQVILLYTGMRYSEAASLQADCLLVRDGVNLIKSTLIKDKPTNLPVDQDEWVAIEIVQDAVRALEELSRCNFNKFLFASYSLVPAHKKANPISNKSLASRLQLYLIKFDEQGTWRDWQLSPHQYRHGLVHQLVRVEVGIPYITRQLKHLYTLLDERSYRINPTSTIYGMQKQVLLGTATGLNAMKDANLFLAIDLYGQDQRFAGGGAALHVERTEAFFRGIGLEGDAREKYIEKLARSGVNAIRTGVGWCVRNHVDPEKLKESPPPCIGDLNCNPHTCVHSVVPESRKSEVIARYRNAAKQLASPDQSHLTSHWQAELDAYSAMLQQLGVDPKSLPAAVISPDTISRVLAVD